MYVCRYMCMYYVYRYVYTHIQYSCTRMYIYVWVCASAESRKSSIRKVHICMYIDICIDMFYIYVYGCICVYVCMNVRKCEISEIKYSNSVDMYIYRYIWMYMISMYKYVDVCMNVHMPEILEIKYSKGVYMYVYRYMYICIIFIYVYVYMCM